MRRDTNDEQKEREDQIGRRPPIPFRVLERRKDRAPGTGVVDEEHSRNGESAKDVERKQTLAPGRERRDRGSRPVVRRSHARARRSAHSPSSVSVFAAASIYTSGQPTAL